MSYEEGDSRYKQIEYYQYGAADRSSDIDHAANQINTNSAAISCSYTRSYNDADIVISSNYWKYVSRSGLTAQKKIIIQLKK